MRDKLGMYLPYLYLAAFLVGGYVLFRYVLTYVLPFAIAVVVAFIIDPLVSFLERKGRFPRGIAVAIVLSFVAGFLFFLLVTVFSKAVQELTQLSKHLPDYYMMAMGLMEDLSERVGDLPIPVRTLAESQVARFLDFLQSLAEAIVVGARGIPHFITGTTVTIIATFFVSKDGKLIAEFLLNLLPPPWRQAYLTTKRDVVVSTFGLVKAQAFLISVSTLISIVGLGVIGVPFALVMGLFIGFVDVLPIVGPSAVYWPWIIGNLIMGNYLFAVALLAVFGIMSLTRSLLEPKVIGARIGLHPLATLFALYLGFRVFGLSGFIIGPLMAILLKASVRSGLLPFPSDGA